MQFLHYAQFDFWQSLWLLGAAILVVLAILSFIYNRGEVERMKRDRVPLEDRSYNYMFLGAELLFVAFLAFGMGLYTANHHYETLLAKWQLKEQEIDLVKIDVVDKQAVIQVGNCQPQVKLLKQDGVYHAYIDGVDTQQPSQTVKLILAPSNEEAGVPAALSQC